MTFYIQDLPYDLMIFPHVLSYSVGFLTNLYIELLLIDIYTMLLISILYLSFISYYHVDHQNQDNRNRVSISCTHITSSV